ncbi:hypothetical protein lerEdw1_012412 [Lerista edwardsae]|nr:hypothetical protein lerEdw1_012412 [Lerista edwardsae]
MVLTWETSRCQVASAFSLWKSTFTVAALGCIFELQALSLVHRHFMKWIMASSTSYWWTQRRISVYAQRKYRPPLPITGVLIGAFG